MFASRIQWLRAVGLACFLFTIAASHLFAEEPILVGVAEADITPPLGFPMAGYYHERLAEGSLDPLWAKAIVFKQGKTAAGLVVCDLIGVSRDLSNEIRKRAAEKTGIPAEAIVIAATHTHTAPDYMKELYLKLAGTRQDPVRAEYIEKLIQGPVEALVRASAGASAGKLSYGTTLQETPVSFNRRFVMRDGSVKTWQAFSNPEVVRQAGPIDPEIAILAVRDGEGKTRSVLSNFALHLDTVGGQKWSADYPYYIQQTLRKSGGEGLISIFGNGACGDINHVNPRSPERNKADFIGGSLGQSIERKLSSLSPLADGRLCVKTQVVPLPLQSATPDEVTQAVKVLTAVRNKEKVEFLDHVVAYRKIMLDQFHRKEPLVRPDGQLTWGLSHALAGVGDAIPVDVTVITLGSEVAVVCVPGEAFVELGLAIKQGSPFKTTLVVELSNVCETVYIPHRAAYAGGSYEVSNSNLLPGGGEIVVETALKLLRDCATQVHGTVK